MKFTHILLALTIAAPGVARAASTSLVTNGDFEATTTNSTNGNFQVTSTGQYGSITGWTVSNSPTSNNPFDLLFTTPGIGANTSVTTSTPGSPSNPSDAIPTANNQYGGGQYLASGFNKTSPTGGNFVALDGDTNVNGYLSQTIGNLTKGAIYELDFDWATAQIATRTGPVTDSLQVSFGNSTQSTPVDSIPSSGFSGWAKQALFFQATSVSQVLSFLSVGAPAGYPPVALLDGVSLVAAPEPSTIALLSVGLAGLVGFSLRRRRAVSTAA